MIIACTGQQYAAAPSGLCNRQSSTPGTLSKTANKTFCCKHQPPKSHRTFFLMLLYFCSIDQKGRPGTVSFRRLIVLAVLPENMKRSGWGSDPPAQYTVVTYFGRKTTLHVLTEREGLPGRDGPDRPPESLESDHLQRRCHSRYRRHRPASQRALVGRQGKPNLQKRYPGTRCGIPPPHQ